MNEKLRALFDEFEQHHGMPMDKSFLDKLEYTHAPPGQDHPDRIDLSDNGSGIHNLHSLTVKHPDHGGVGSIDWTDDAKTVDMIYVDPDHRHKGVASALWNKAREIEPDLKHSWEMTPKGRDWATSLGEEDAEHVRKIDELSKSASQTRTCVLCRNVFDESEDGEATGFCQSCREKEGLVTHHSWSEDAQEGHYGSKDALEAWALGGSSERSDEEVFEPLHRMVEAADPVDDRLHRGTSLSVNGIRQLREGIEEVNLPLTSWSTNRKVAEDEAGSYGDRHGVVFHLSPGARAVKNTQNKFGEAEYISKGKFKVNRIEQGDPYHVYLNPVTEKTAADKSKKRAIMAIGIPGSGKSTLMKPYAQALGAAYVSSDETRKEVTGDEADVSQDAVVWPRIYEKLHQALDENDTVVFDSTASNYEKRLDAIRHLREKAGTVEGIHFDLPLDVAHQRNDQRDRHVPPEIIDAMHAQLEANPPGDEFDSVQVVGGSNPRVGEDSPPDRGLRSSRLARKTAAMAASKDYQECRFCLGSGRNGGQRCSHCAATGSEGTVPCQACGNPLRAFEVFVASGPTCAACVGRISA